jgi:hypothetical protein
VWVPGLDRLEWVLVHWVPVVDHWVPAVDYWVPAVDHWVLAVDHWVLEPAGRLVLVPVPAHHLRKQLGQ